MRSADGSASGEYRIFLDERTYACPAASFIFIPAGIRHGFRVGAVRSRKLTLYTKAAMVGCFDALSAAIKGGDADPLHRDEIARRHGMDVVGPVPEGYLWSGQRLVRAAGGPGRPGLAQASHDHHRRAGQDRHRHGASSPRNRCDPRARRFGSGAVNGDPRVLEIDGISKRYGQTVAVRDLTFEIHAGELFGFVGRNGAGKTTTMRIILGVLASDAGVVRWLRVPLAFETRRRIGYMPEERGLYPRMRVAEQLTYLGELHGMTGAEAREAALGWLDRFGLADRRDADLQALSLGNQQRVQLAAALVFGPDVLVLDEPFAGLDPVAVDVMAGVLREQADAGVPVIFSSHELDLVERLCDRVGIIDHGRLVACGTVEELRAGAQERCWIDAPGAPGEWEAGVPGVRLVRTDGTRRLFELDPGVDDQVLLQAALATGPVREFEGVEPTLGEIFRTVLGDAVA